MEWALVAPLAVLLLVGTVEAGRAAFQYSLLSHAVREAARRAAVEPALQVDDPDVLAALDALLATGGVRAMSRSVQFRVPLETGDRITVSAEVLFTPALPLGDTARSRAEIPLRAETVTHYELSEPPPSTPFTSIPPESPSTPKPERPRAPRPESPEPEPTEPQQVSPKAPREPRPPGSGTPSEGA